MSQEFGSPKQLKIMARVLLLALVLAATGCRGQLLATAELHGAGTAEVHFRATGAPLVLWADIDGKWRGHSRTRFPAHYEVELLVGGASIGHFSCDTNGQSTEVCGTLIGSDNEQRGDCELKLSCAIPAIPAGDVVLRVQGTPGKDVILVSKMSVNVRDK